MMLFLFFMFFRALLWIMTVVGLQARLEYGKTNLQVSTCTWAQTITELQNKKQTTTVEQGVNHGRHTIPYSLHPKCVIM